MGNSSEHQSFHTVINYNGALRIMKQIDNYKYNLTADYLSCSSSLRESSQVYSC